MNADPQLRAMSFPSHDGADGAALFHTLYAQLHRLAASQVARNGCGSVLGTTSLLHEAYLAIDGHSAVFPDRSRFMAYAARVMRSVVIDWVRHQKTQKRGGAFQITVFEDQTAIDVADVAQLQRVEDALDDLAKLEPELAHIVDLKFFCGLTFSEIAALRSLSERTIERKWEKARVYLFRALESG